MDIVEKFKKFYSGAIADVLFSLGYRGTVDASIRPIYPGIKICGVAYTIKYIPRTRTNLKSIADEAKEACKPNSIVVVDCGGSIESTVWGENSCTACMVRGAVGFVIDGACRDTRELRKMKVPVFCRAISPGIRRKALVATAYQIPVSCGGIQVHPGDIVFGDDDGVVIVPEELAGQVLNKLYKYAEADRMVKKLLMEGKSVKEAYKIKRGIL